MSGPRIAPVTDPTPDQTKLFEAVANRWGRVINVFGTMGTHPPMLERVRMLGRTFITEGHFEPRERELVILRVAAYSRCAYEWAHHAVSGSRVGLTEEIDWLLQPLDDPRSGWSDGDRALLAFVDDLLATSRVADEHWSRLAERFDDFHLVELIGLVGFYRLLAGFICTVGVELDSGLPDPPPEIDWI